MTETEPGRAAEHLEPSADEPHHRPAIGAVLVAGMAVALGAAFLGVPREHAALSAVARYAMVVSLPDWKLTEPVNEVVYGTRGFDTFGETFLLLAAVISVVLLTRSRESRRGYFGEDSAGMREQSEIDPSEPADPTENEARAAEKAENGGGDQDGDQDGGQDGSPRGPARPRTPDHTPLGTPAPEHAEAMSVVVRTAVRVAIPILAVTGL